MLPVINAPSGSHTSTAADVWLPHTLRFFHFSSITSYARFFCCLFFSSSSSSAFLVASFCNRWPFWCACSTLSSISQYAAFFCCRHSSDWSHSSSAFLVASSSSAFLVASSLACRSVLFMWKNTF